MDSQKLFDKIDALWACGFTSLPVKLILRPDEETSSRHSKKKSIDFMCRMKKGLAVFLNAEGIVRYRFTVTGKAAHSSKCTDSANAVAEAAKRLAAVAMYI